HKRPHRARAPHRKGPTSTWAVRFAAPRPPRPRRPALRDHEEFTGMCAPSLYRIASTSSAMSRKSNEKKPYRGLKARTFSPNSLEQKSFETHIGRRVLVPIRSDDYKPDKIGVLCYRFGGGGQPGQRAS